MSSVGEADVGKAHFFVISKVYLCRMVQHPEKSCTKEKDSEKSNHRTQSQEIGFVMQNPDNQIVTDKVWHELSFGLESLGYDNATIRLRVAEMASYFGSSVVLQRSGGTVRGTETAPQSGSDHGNASVASDSG